MAFYDILQILSPVPDVGYIMSFDDCSFYFREIVPLVEADVLGMVEDWKRSIDCDPVGGLFQ